MEPIIRPARPDDLDQVAVWTRDTFAWGDYIAERWDDWVASEDGHLVVAEVDGTVAGLAYVAMVSSREAWSQGMRVHPEFRRQGLGTLIGEALWPWAAERGAAVVRLAVEDWNTAAQGQVQGMGFRPVSTWLYAERGVGENSPVPEGNGGRRVPAEESLRPANAAEAEPAYLSWTSGDLARASRGLFPQGWTWMRLTAEHLAAAARERTLWAGRPGWALADLDDTQLRVHWLETVESDARAMVRALVDRAAGAGSERLTAMIPAVDWLRQAFERSAFEMSPLRVWAKEL
jgi:GNAT superfamily N-acetyltransferase